MKKDSTPMNVQPEPAKPMVFFILGGPGAGKGTLCEQMARDLGFHHFSTGELLRKELEENPASEYSTSIRNHMAEGKLVSSELLLNILTEDIKKINESNPKILLDGFPRNKENLEAWRKMELNNQFDVKYAIFLDCGFDTMESNILERAKTSGREDDSNMETIRKRISVFDAKTKPLLEIFEKEEKIIKVDAEKSPEHIFQEVKSHLKLKKLIRD